MNMRRLRSGVKGVMVDGQWVEDSGIVKICIMEFFKIRFKEEVCQRPTLDGVSLERLTEEGNSALCARFSKEKVWDCGGDKSPDQAISTSILSRNIGPFAQATCAPEC